MIRPLHIEADVTASVDGHVVRIHGEGEQVAVDASSWTPLLKLWASRSALGFPIPGPLLEQTGTLTTRVRGTTVLTLRLGSGRIRRRLHPLGVFRSLLR